MTRYIVTRLGLLVLGLGVASILIFFALRVLPGDAAQVIAGSSARPEQVEALREKLGLNQSLATQYAQWIGGIITRFDFGTSPISGASVGAELLEKSEVTLPLGLAALAFALLLSVPLGILAAVRRARPTGAAIGLASQLLAAIPVIWAGMLLVMLFALGLDWLPAQGFPRQGWSEPGRAAASLLLPAITIATVEGAVLLRFVRSATLEAIGQDYVRTAAAQGRTRTGALLRQGIPNVALSVITVLGLQLAGIIVGAVVVEKLFSLPGIGRMLVADVGNRDLPMVQGELLVLTGVVLIIGFIVDIVHRLIDPRLREAS